MNETPASVELPRDLKNWEALRQRGKKRFILITGVLSYGVPMFFVMTFFVNRKSEVMPEPLRLGISLVIWLLGGAVFGLIMWKLNEGRYQKFLAKQAKTET